MEIQNCPAPRCARPFQLNTFTTELVTSIERGQIICPHCGHVMQNNSESLFLTHALSPDQEEKFSARSGHAACASGQAGGVEVFWGEMSACEHFVQVYEDDTGFMNTLEGFIGDGLQAGDSAIVIATPGHLAELNQRLAARRIDVEAVRERDQYIPLVAEETLASFMVDGWPDDALFSATVTDVLARAQRDGRKVRAFGEMVAILWAQGHSAATVRLEHLWNKLCRERAFSLFCAYPKVGFTENASESIAHVCSLHSRVIAV
jgi:hypothetical protein